MSVKLVYVVKSNVFCLVVSMIVSFGNVVYGSYVCCNGMIWLIIYRKYLMFIFRKMSMVS